MFKISSDPIDPAAQQALLANPSAGACVTFEGWVRNRNDGRPVLFLEYEAHPALAEKEGARILDEARTKFALLGAVALHRTGRLQPGDLAVWIAVTAAHRGVAFDACRFLIDEVKARVPIWKKEHYADGSGEWINCATAPDAAV